jgi:hypothetical protein
MNRKNLTRTNLGGIKKMDLTTPKTTLTEYVDLAMSISDSSDQVTTSSKLLRELIIDSKHDPLEIDQENDTYEYEWSD